MHQSVWKTVGTAVVMISVSYGCASNDVSSPTPDTSATPDPSGVSEVETEEGMLQVRANGEDFVREGFVSKDGWDIGFDHLYVSLANVKAYQTDAPFDPETGAALEPQQDVLVVEQQTVDLAEGEADADPILLAEVSAPAGRYNALEWTMPTATEGPAAGHVLMLVGTAEKDGQVVNFTLRLDQEMRYVCGDFVGDERKGILEAGSVADLEATFHFDHIFGDGEADPGDDINTGALGFAPLAAIAQGDTLDVDMAMLEEQLSPDDYARLQDTIAGLGHVGEGHCALEDMA